MFKMLILSLFYLCLVHAKFVTKNYCCLSCGEKHVMCRFPDDTQIGRNCKDYRNVVLDSEKVLNLFNRMKSVKGVYAGATNIMKMEWDFELESMAQRWANQCPNQTDECRNTARGTVNQIVDSIINEQFVSPTWESVFLKWYIQEIPLENILKYKPGPYAALSQVIWGNTRRVGCAASSHLIDTGRLVTMVCNYSPPGNIPGEQIFDIDGGMCTKCPDGSTCKDKLNVNLCVPLGAPTAKINLVLLFILLFISFFV